MRPGRGMDRKTDFAVRRDDLTRGSRLLAGMRAAILEGRFRPGQHLTERELCQVFQVSRSLVREVVPKLAAEELVAVVPHRGLMVPLPDRKATRDLYRVRAALEGLACAEFVALAGEAERAALFSAAARLAALSEHDPQQAPIEAKDAFWRCLLAGCGNGMLAPMLTRLHNRVVQLRRLSLAQPGRLAAVQHEIAAIVEAIRRRDADAARRLAEAHVAAAAAAADSRFEAMEHAALAAGEAAEGPGDAALRRAPAPVRARPRRARSPWRR